MLLTGRAYTVPETPESVPARDLVRTILRTYRSRLVAEDYALVRDPTTVDEVMRQVGFILEDVLLPPDALQDAESRLFSVEVGANRARAGVHPTESLRAAALLFEVALPMILAPQAHEGVDRAMGICLALHQAVMDRVVLASMSYVEFLLEKLQGSRREERRRIARELHDRIGHGMGLALQHLDLHRHYAAVDPPRADVKLASAMSSLTESIQTVQQISAELRRSVGDAGTERALQAYLRANVPPDVSATLEVQGDAKALPPNVGEELYLILREATRNALRHALANTIRLSIAIGDTVVSASVTDNGRGFVPGEPAAKPSGGLPSMTERTDLLRGRLSIDSAPGRGTTISVWVPLDGGSL
jgi:signal transduction histidine kinase